MTLGLNGGVGVYNLSGGGTLKAIREMIGGDSASAGLFNQTGGTNSLENALGGDPLSVGANSLYEISGSGSELNTSGLEVVNRRGNGPPDRRARGTPWFVTDRGGSARLGEAGLGCAAGASADR